MSAQIIIEATDSAGEHLLEFDEVESFYHDIECSEYSVIQIAYVTSHKDKKFALLYQPHYFCEGTLMTDCYILKFVTYTLYLHRNFIEFESNKTRGKISFDIRMKLKDFIDIKFAPFDLELDYDMECAKNFDNFIADEDLDIDVDIEKIEKKLQRFEMLRLFL